MILVPVKNFGDAKQRLSPVLGQAEREALARAMLEDVLQAIAGVRPRQAVAIVTGDSWAEQAARSLGFEIISDPSNESETAAIQMATAVCASRGEDSTLVIPGDIPLIQSGEIEQVLAAAPAEGMVLVPAWDGRGTNAVLRRPADLFPLRFGNDSFQPHLEAAQLTGKECVVLNLAGIALDVDTPADLVQLLDASGNTRSQDLLREWGHQPRAVAVNE
jgi:2-phospho-L-lactate guanylyltransferase